MTYSNKILGSASLGVCTLGNPLPDVTKYWVADHASCALWGGVALLGRTPQYHYIELFKTQYSFTAGDRWTGPIQSAHGTLIWIQYFITNSDTHDDRLALTPWV